MAGFIPTVIYNKIGDLPKFENRTMFFKFCTGSVIQFEMLDNFKTLQCPTNFVWVVSYKLKFKTLQCIANFVCHIICDLRI